MAKNLTEALLPIREKRMHFESNPDLVEDIIQEGNTKARKVAIQTMNQVRSAMNI